jgi:hypothetical protein
MAPIVVPTVSQAEELESLTRPAIQAKELSLKQVEPTVSLVRERFSGPPCRGIAPLSNLLDNYPLDMYASFSLAWDRRKSKVEGERLKVESDGT